MCFREIIDPRWNNIRLAAVVSNEDAETCWWGTNGIYKYSRLNGIPFIPSEVRNNEKIAQYIKDYNIDCLISNGYGWIIPGDIIDMVKGNAFNLHLAPLPQYGGNYTYNHAILNGEREYGITLHYMTSVVDCGDYIYRPMFEVDVDETAYSLYKKSMKVAIDSFVRLLSVLNRGDTPDRYPMTGERCLFRRESMDDLRRILDLRDVEEVDRKSRAFYFPPFEGAYFIGKNEKKYYVLPQR